LIQQQEKKTNNDSNDAKQYFEQALEIYSSEFGTTSLQAETVRNKILECSK
jgi:hypothetical protein